MEKMQFCAAVLMGLLTLTLVLVPRRENANLVPFRSRWFMAVGTGLLALQFVFQIKLGLRDMDLPQAVMLNLFMFVPASWMLNLGILHIQRKGNLARRDWWVGVIAWTVVTALLFIAQYLEHDPVVVNNMELPVEVIMADFVFLGMQCHFTFLHFRGLRRIHRSLDNYYDRDMSELLRTMEQAIVVLATLAVLAPVAMFDSGWVLGVFGLLFLLGIYYFVLSFVVYVFSSTSNQVSVAEEHADEQELEDEEEKAPAPQMGDEDRQRIESAVNRWIEQGKHLRSGLTIQAAADEMKIPRYQLSTWLKTTDQELFNPWLTHKRIEEAKRLIIAHPDWSNDIIAEQCGFGSRSYFQTVFHKQTGMTPANFIQSESAR